MWFGTVNYEDVLDVTETYTFYELRLTLGLTKLEQQNIVWMHRTVRSLEPYCP